MNRLKCLVLVGMMLVGALALAAEETVPYEGAWGIALSPDEHTLYMTDRVGTLFLHDVETGTLQRILRPSWPYLFSGGTAGVSVSPDGRHVVAIVPSSDYGMTPVWEIGSGTPVIDVRLQASDASSPVGPADGVTTLTACEEGQCFPPDAGGFSRSLLAAAKNLGDGTVLLGCWDTATGKHLTGKSVRTGENGWWSGWSTLTVHPVLPLAVAACERDLLFLRLPGFDVVKRMSLRSILPPGGALSWLSFAGSGQDLVGGFTFADDQEPVLFRVPAHRPPERLGTLRNWRGKILAQALNRDGTLLATGGTAGRIVLWDLPSLQPLTNWKGHEGNIRGFAFASNGTVLYSCCDAGGADLGLPPVSAEIKAWAVPTGAPLRTFPVSAPGEK